MEQIKQVHACWRMIRISPQFTRLLFKGAVKILEGMKNSLAP